MIALEYRVISNNSTTVRFRITVQSDWITKYLGNQRVCYVGKDARIYGRSYKVVFDSINRPEVIAEDRELHIYLRGADPDWDRSVLEVPARVFDYLLVASSIMVNNAYGRTPANREIYFSESSNDYSFEV